jgi:flavin-dependent dehydrogenase
MRFGVSRLQIDAAETGWRVRFDHGSQHRSVFAKALVNAAGQRNQWSRRFGGLGASLDDLVGLVGVFATSQVKEGGFLLEAAPTGWWYSANLPNQTTIAMFFTDGDLLPGKSRATLAAAWSDRIRETKATAKRCGDLTLTGRFRLVSARTSRAALSASSGYVAVGDAAASHDPISGSGMLHAVETGVAAGTALDGYFRGETCALSDYQNHADIDFCSYLSRRKEVYGHVERWPDNTFWQRRRAP